MKARLFSRLSLYSFLFSNLLLPALSYADAPNLAQGKILETLGWVSKPDANRCGGYYVEPDLHSTDTNISIDSLKTAPFNISANSSDLQQTNISTLRGNVIISQTGRLIQADSAQLIRDPKTHRISSIDLKGHVIVREPSKVTVGDHVHIAVDQNQAVYESTFYRFGLNFEPIALIKTDGDNNKVNGLVAQGKASQIKQIKKGYYVLKDASYTTCTPATATWHLHAKQIDLNHETGRGTADDATVYIKSVPIFYTPYLNFPIDKRRVSGFLSPTYGNSSQGGFSLSLPYYWNLAPNYDMTITPTWYSKRGVLTATKNRFLTDKSNGEMDVGFLPNDQAFSTFKKNAQTEYAPAPPNAAVTSSELQRLADASSSRWFYHLTDITNFSPNLQGNVDFTRVSDDYVQQDLGLSSLMTGQLLEQGALNYSSDYWNAGLLAQQYQTLHPVTMLSNSNQYARLPDLTFNLNYPTNPYVNYLLSAETVNFTRQLNPGETFNSPNGEPTNGIRNNFQPGVSIPWNNNFAFFKPTLQWEFTEYALNNQQMGYNNQITRNLPILDIDSGLYFDRETHLFGQDYDETLEPRVYYLRVPYRPQYQIPDFDTAIQGFTFDQLFQTNRFTSIDRIGDANQISLALSTRFLDADSGMQKSQLGIGRIYYANERKVMLCGQFECQDSQYTVNSTSPTEPASPVVGFINYTLTKNWSTNVSAAWDPRAHSLNNSSAIVQYMPTVNHIINIGYNFVEFGDPASPPTADPNDRKNNLSQVSASGAWPLTEKVDGLAAWNYNISHEHFQTYLYGLSYNACCYAMRLALARSFFALDGNGTPQFNRQILLQLVLKGFGGVGQSNSLNTIATNIPGYQDTFYQNVY